MSHHYQSSKLPEKSPSHAAKGQGRPFHRTWWFWLALVLMLGAMLLYGLA